MSMQFTSHTVVLPGNKRVGKDAIPLAESNIWKSIKETIGLLLPPNQHDYSKMRVADLGCLEGAYSVEFARMGFQVVGIEARQENVNKCNYLKSHLNLNNLNFVTDDVRNLSKYGEFDIVLCYGLLYHLNDPVNFLRIVSNVTTKLLLLNTHFAPESDIRYNLKLINRFMIAPLQKRVKALKTRTNYRLSAITTNEGYRGRWYREWKKTESKNKIEKKLLWTSYNNDQSFWLCKKDLTRAMVESGFRHVFERFDFTGDLFSDNYTHLHSRTMFIGFKPDKC